MFFQTLLVTILVVLITNSEPEVSEDCTWNGIPLHGDEQVVDSFPDIKVKVVESFPDLNVQVVDSFPDSCGQWKFVDSFPDFKIQYVENFPDIEIRMVESFPGVE